MISSEPPPIGPEARVARGALDPVLVHVAGAAVDLQARVHQLEGGALGQQLGHRDLLQRFLAGDEAAQRVVGDAAAGVGGGGEVGELVADRLVLDSGRPKAWRSRANSAVRSHASCIAPTAPSAIARRSHWKLAMISLKPSCQLAEQVLLGHEHVLEGDRRGVGGVPAELLELRRS